MMIVFRVVVFCGMLIILITSSSWSNAVEKNKVQSERITWIGMDEMYQDAVVASLVTVTDGSATVNERSRIVVYCGMQDQKSDIKFDQNIAIVVMASSWNTRAVWIDVDGDGGLELIVATSNGGTSYSTVHVLKRFGPGGRFMQDEFEIAMHRRDISENGCRYGFYYGDIDNDGKIELLLSSTENENVNHEIVPTTFRLAALIDGRWKEGRTIMRTKIPWNMVRKL